MKSVPRKRSLVAALCAAGSVAATAACGSAPVSPAAHSSSTAISVAIPRAAATPTSLTRLTETQTAASTAATPRQFTSARYGFRVTLTSAWTEQDAQVDWDGKKLQGIGSPAFANFTDPVDGRTLVTGAAPVAKGTQLSQWRSSMVRAAPEVCTEAAATEQTTLGGEPALTWTATCSDGYNVTKLAAVHDHRGYMIFLPSASTNDIVLDRAVFESVRKSFSFTR